jgi:hypothetical protein
MASCNSTDHAERRVGDPRPRLVEISIGALGDISILTHCFFYLPSPPASRDRLLCQRPPLFLASNHSGGGRPKCLKAARFWGPSPALRATRVTARLHRPSRAGTRSFVPRAVEPSAQLRGPSASQRSSRERVVRHSPGYRWKSRRSSARWLAHWPKLSSRTNSVNHDVRCKLRVLWGRTNRCRRYTLR